MEKIGFEALYTVLPEREADKVAMAMAGYSVVFRKRDVIRKMIRRDFDEMTRAGWRRPDAVKSIASAYECHPSTVYRIIRDGGDA